jgi:hypothetical protein
MTKAVCSYSVKRKELPTKAPRNRVPNMSHRPSSHTGRAFPARRIVQWHARHTLPVSSCAASTLPSLHAHRCVRHDRGAVATLACHFLNARRMNSSNNCTAPRGPRINQQRTHPFVAHVAPTGCLRATCTHIGVLKVVVRAAPWRPAPAASVTCVLSVALIAVVVGVVAAAPGASARRLIRDLLDAPTALAACCGFDLCHKYILYLYLYFFRVPLRARLCPSTPAASAITITGKYKSIRIQIKIYVRHGSNPAGHTEPWRAAAARMRAPQITCSRARPAHLQCGVRRANVLEPGRSVWRRVLVRVPLHTHAPITAVVRARHPTCCHWRRARPTPAGRDAGTPASPRPVAHPPGRRAAPRLPRTSFVLEAPGASSVSTNKKGTTTELLLLTGHRQKWHVSFLTCRSVCTSVPALSWGQYRLCTLLVCKQTM